MNWRILSIGFTFALILTTSPLLLADGEATGIAHRVAALEQQMTTLMAELERESPDPDLTGKTYCLITQGIELIAEGLSAQVELHPVNTRMDFTSPTQVTVMDIAGPLARLNFPSYTMSDQGDSQVSEGTYTMVGSQLAVTLDDADDDGATTLFLTLTPDGQAFIGSLTWRGVEEGYDAFGNHIMMGVRADSCDL
jgi:hypothetical protein